MVVKTITVTEDAYAAIKRLKQEDESFSDLFLRIGKKRVLTAKDLVGRISPEEGAAWMKRIEEIRKRHSEGLGRRIDDVRARLQRAD